MDVTCTKNAMAPYKGTEGLRRSQSAEHELFELYLQDSECLCVMMLWFRRFQRYDRYTTQKKQRPHDLLAGSTVLLIFFSLHIFAVCITQECWRGDGMKVMLPSPTVRTGDLKSNSIHIDKSCEWQVPYVWIRRYGPNCALFHCCLLYTSDAADE